MARDTIEEAQKHVIGVRVTYSPLDRNLEAMLTKLATVDPDGHASGTTQPGQRRDVFWPCMNNTHAQDLADSMVELVAMHTQDGRVEVCSLKQHWDRKQAMLKELQSSSLRKPRLY